MTRLLKLTAIILLTLILLDVVCRDAERDAVRRRQQQERRNPPTRHSEDDVMGMYGEGDDATL